MEDHYHHLTKQDRIFLRIMLEKRYPKAKIAKILGVHRSTIYREIKRNNCTHWYSKKTYYDSQSAHKKYLNRRKRETKLSTDRMLQSYVHDKLIHGWSPWQIEGRLKSKHESRAFRTTISHETIYRYIYSDYAVRNRFYKKLRRKHCWRVKHFSRKPRIPSELMIQNRSELINSRREFGHWECDLMIFKRGRKANLITMRERKSRYIIIIKNSNKSASGTALSIISKINQIKDHIKSITFDQGSEFQKYAWIKDCLDTDIYFCEPGSPHQKGAIENGNGVIRSELSRDDDIDILEQRQINKISNEINDRPLKCLNYETPAELFFEYTKNFSLTLYEN